MAFTFRTLTDTDPAGVARLCSASDDPARDLTLVSECLRDGTARPAWCFWAETDIGEIMAGVSWWAEPGTSDPILADLVGAADPAAAAALLRHSRECLGIADAEASVVLPHDAPESRRRAAQACDQALVAADFTISVERVRVEWLDRDAVPASAGRLTYLAARDQPEDLLVELFAAVSDDSLDDGMRRRRAQHGRDAEARKRLDSALNYKGEPDWFSVGLNSAGAPVGYVLPALVNGDRPVLAEIGVAAPHRGHRYVDDLLAYGTALLHQHGAERVRGDTDAGNLPMRAAFRRGRYREFASRTDYRWHNPATR
jgi:hypothetical protein